MNQCIARQRRAHYDYTLGQSFEAGLVLEGWEIKSIRAGKVQIRDAYVIVKRSQVYLVGSHITPLETTCRQTQANPTRSRLLLLNRSEIKKIEHLPDGLTLVPTAMYFKKGWVKIAFSIGKGKKKQDQRESIKKRQWNIEKAKILKQFRTRI